MTKEIENFAFNCLQKLIYSHMGRKCTILQIPDTATTVTLAWEGSRTGRPNVVKESIVHSSFLYGSLPMFLIPALD